MHAHVAALVCSSTAVGHSRSRTACVQVHKLQQQLTEVCNQLQLKFESQHRRFRKRWLNLAFDEKSIEEAFEQTTYNGQRAYMYLFMIVLLIYIISASLYFNVSLRFGVPPDAPRAPQLVRCVWPSVARTLVTPPSPPSSSARVSRALCRQFSAAVRCLVRRL